MTIVTATARIAYTGDGTTTAFAVPFFFNLNSDLVVSVQDTSGNVTTKVLGVDYNLTGSTLPNGGTCTFVAAPTLAFILAITRVPPITQTASYNNNDPFPAKSHELALDKGTTVDQYLKTLMDRSIQVAPTDTAPMVTLPPAAVRALKNFTFDASGNPSVSTPVTGTTVSSAMIPVVTAVTLSAAEAALGISVGMQPVVGASTLALARNALGAGNQTGGSVAIYNGSIVESHAGNAATFAMKTVAGADPSANDPCFVPFIKADGTYVQRAVTAALSVTISSGSTLGQQAGFAFQLGIIALDNAGTVELAVASRIGPTTAAGQGINGLYLSEGLPMTTFAEGGVGSADNVATLYSTTARTNVSISVLCRADYDSGLVSNGSWAVSPTRLVMQRSGSGVRGVGMPASFAAHRNNVAQPGALHLAYTKVLFTNTRFSVGNFYDTTNSRWIPPAGLVQMSGNVWYQGNFAQTAWNGVPQGSADAVAKLIKNGFIDISAGTGYAPSGFPNTAGATLANAVDLANGTDFYELWAYSTSAAALNNVIIDGNPAHTWFSGASVGN